MPSDGELIDLVAAALRGDDQWDSLSIPQKAPWRADADRVIKALRSAARTGPDVAGFEACREAAIEYWSDWLVDAVAGATQDRKFIRGDDKEDIMATGAILNNGRKAIKSAIAALPAPAGESVTGWQDIETAPKDGTEIIGIYFRPEDGLFKVTIYGPWTIAFDRGKWRSSWGRSEVIEYMGDFGTDYKEPDCEPTHWCPLPAFTITRKGEARS
jgi:hypothetical protein